MAEVKKEVDFVTKRKTLSFFLLIFPSVILAAIPSSFGNNVLYPLTIKILLLFYLYFVTKNFVESAYE